MRILQLRAARGWTLEKTARRFLVDLQTLLHWVRRVDETGEHALVQTVEPVNRYPDVVRNLVRQLKCHFPSMGYERMAQMLARLGLFLAATTLRRIVRDATGSPPEPPVAISRTARRRAVARRPGDVWHIDLTTVPTRTGASVPWFPFSLPQRWPYCWWVAVIVDQVSRCFVGFAVFSSVPTSKQLETCLDRAVRRQEKPPRYIVSDRGPQFTSRSYRRWCGRHGIRRRFGFLGESNSIAIVERFIRSMKQECFRRLFIAPMTLGAMRRELGCYARWYNEHRPHTTLRAKTPSEVFRGQTRHPRRIETRERWPYQPRGRPPGNTVTLDVSYVAGRKHLPVIGLRRAA
jgi:transposase InsO family protein